MKKRILTLIVAIMLSALTAFTLTACGGDKGDSSDDVSVTGVTLNNSSVILEVGDSLTLRARVTPSDATEKDVTWKSANRAVATVSNGKVTAVSEGVTAITVTTVDGGFTATCSVTVIEGNTNDEPNNPSNPDNPIEPDDPTHTHVYVEHVTEPTCTERGYTTFTCSCEDSYVDNYVDALNHLFTNYVSDNNATYEADGTKTAVCDREGCNETDTVVDEGTKLISYADIYTYDNAGEITGLTAYGKTLSELVIPEEINGVTITSIGEGAFSDCESLTSIEIPDSVTNIGTSAFDGCRKLIEVINKSSLNIQKGSEDYGYVGKYALTIHNGESKIVNAGDYQFITGDDGVNYLFNYIGDDTELKLPANYNGQDYFINEYAFRNCDSLTSIEIPDSVTSIGYGAFRSCDSLTSVTIGNSVTSIGDSAFYNCPSLTSIEIPNSVTNIGSSAFEKCDSLTSIVIPDSVTSIGYWTFYECKSLTSVVIGDSVTSIGDRAFYECDSLTSIEIPGSVTSIGSYTFYGCGELKNVLIGYGLESIGDNAFTYCSKLDYVNYFGSADTWAQIDFGSGSNPASEAGDLYIDERLATSISLYSVGKISNYAFEDLSSLTSVVIGGETTSIGDSAFSDCVSLTRLTIGSNVKNIGKKAFFNCNSLSSITIPNSVTSIGSKAFQYCLSLASVTIPNSVTKIGNYAFSGCSSLTSITFKDTSTWYMTTSVSNWNNKTGGTRKDLTDINANANTFKVRQDGYYWYKL